MDFLEFLDKYGDEHKSFYLTLCMLTNFSCFCCHLLTSKLTFEKKNSGTLSDCHMVRIQIRPDILWVLIWVLTLSKGYQQTTKVTASRHRVDQYPVVVFCPEIVVCLLHLLHTFIFTPDKFDHGSKYFEP